MGSEFAFIANCYRAPERSEKQYQKGKRTAVGRFKGASCCRVDYYLAMIRLMGQDTTAMKVIAGLLTDPKRRGHHTTRDCMGKNWGAKEQREWGKLWARVRIVACI